MRPYDLNRKIWDITIALIILSAIAASIFAACDVFPDKLIDSKYYTTYGLICLLSIILVPRLYIKHQIPHNLFTQTFIWGTSAICTAQATFFICQKIGLAPLYCQFGAGSFENVAGFASCLAFSLPLGMSLRRKGLHNFLSHILLLSKIICIIAILWSESRTGMLCILAWLIMEFAPKDKQKWLTLAFPVLMLGTLLYKSDSTKGRWLILQRTIKMICECPFFGYGKDGFTAHYMDFQADYFADNPTDKYSMLADNIRHPLNEWMAATIDFGLIGLLGISLFFYITYCYAKKNKSQESILGSKILCTMGIFSFFSYPFQYPFSWLMLAFSLWSIYQPFLLKHIRMVAMLGLCCTIPWTYHLSMECKDNMALKKMQEKSKLGLSDRNLQAYQEMYPRMKNDKRFLFYYASDLYLAEHFTQALKIAKECKLHLTDYELSLMIGDIYRELGEKDSTIYYYHRAHNMCPSHFTPLYEMLHTYQEFGDSTSSQKIKILIQNKPIKVWSKETENIIKEAK